MGTLERTAPSIIRENWLHLLLLLASLGLLFCVTPICDKVAILHGRTGNASVPVMVGAMAGATAFGALETASKVAPVKRFAFFHFRAGFGLHNNMAYLRFQLLAAKWALRTAVLPRVMPSRGRLAKQKWEFGVPLEAAASEWRDVPLADFLDLEYYRSCTARLGVRTLTADEADAAGVPAPFVYSVAGEDGYSSMSRFEELIVDTRVSIESPYISFGAELITRRPELLSQVTAMDTCLSYHPDLIRVAALLGKSIEGKFGAPVGRMVALHARLEDDMLEALSYLGSPEARMMGKIQHCMLQVAPPPKAGADKVPILVLTGESFGKDKYAWLRAAYGDLVFTKEDIEFDLIEGLRFTHGLDAGTAVIDVLLAQESALFVGTWISSLSVRIAQYRHRLGRVSYMMNGAVARKTRPLPPLAPLHFSRTPHKHAEMDKESPSCTLVDNDWVLTWADNSTSHMIA